MDELKDVLLSTFSASQKTIGEHNKKTNKVTEVLREAIKEDEEGQGREKIIEEFHKALFKNVCKFLVIDDAKQNANVERVIQFTAKLIQALAISGEDDDAGDFLLNSLCKASESSSKTVRLRSVQVIVAVLDLLSDDTNGGGFEIDEGIFAALVEHMTRRSRDKNSAVRLEAILALSRLQNPDDKDDPVIELFLHSMEVDPSALIRKAILSNIAITNATLRHILRRVRDSSDSVRATAFRVLSEKVDVRSLSVKQKVALVSAGNGDRSPTVRNIFSSMVRDQWLVSLSQNKDPLAVIRCVDPAENEKEAEALAHCLSSIPRRPKEDTTSDSAPKSSFLSKESLSAEEALWWRVLCIEALKEDSLSVPEELIPDLTTLAGTIERLAKESPFVCTQVLCVAEAAARGSSDVVGRTACAQALCKLLKSGDINDSLVEPILEALGSAWASPEEGKRMLFDDILAHLNGIGEENLDFLEAFRYRIALIACFGLCSCRECLSANEVDDLFQKVALPCIQHREARVREVGIKMSAMSCIVAPYAETLNTFLPIIALALRNDQSSVRCVAAKGLFDVVGTFGFDKLAAAVSAVDVRNELLSAFNEISCDDVNSDDADLLTAFAEGFAKLFFLGYIGLKDNVAIPLTDSNDDESVGDGDDDDVNDDVSNEDSDGGGKQNASIKATDILARLAVFMHLPALRKPPLLRQCLSVFFAAYVCPPRSGNPEKAAERMRLLELTVGPAMEYAVKVEGTLEFAVKLARFLLRLVLAGTRMAAAAAVKGSGITSAEAVAKMQSRVLLDLAGRAYKQVVEGEMLSRVYCFIISKCLLAFVNFEDVETVKLLLAYVELLTEKSDDAISKKALGSFCKALKRDKRFKYDFVDNVELYLFKEKAIKRLEKQEAEDVKNENEIISIDSDNDDDNGKVNEDMVVVKIEEEDDDEKDGNKEEKEIDNEENNSDDVEIEVKIEKEEEEEEEEPKTPRQDTESMCESATPLKTSSTSNFAALMEDEAVGKDESSENGNSDNIEIDDFELKRRERRKTIAGIPNPDWYVSPSKSQSRMKLYPRRMSLGPVIKPKDIMHDIEEEDEEKGSDDEEIDFYDDDDNESEEESKNTTEETANEEEIDENDGLPPEKKRRISMNDGDDESVKMEEEDENENSNDDNDDDDDDDDIDFYIDENVDIPPKNQRRKSIPALVSSSRDFKEFLDKLNSNE